MTETSRPTALSLLRMSLGFIVWSSCFVVLYGGLSLGCRLTLATHSFAGVNGVSLALILLWAAHVALLAALVAQAARWAGGFTADSRRSPVPIPSLTLILDSSALIGAVWIGVPVLFLPPCA